MNTPTFLAWSLLAAGGFALCFLLIRRAAIATGARPPVLTNVQRVNIVFLSLFVSATCTKVICDIIDVPLPAWTHLVPGAMVLALGATFRTQNRSYGNASSTRLLANILMVMGALILALEIVRP